MSLPEGARALLHTLLDRYEQPGRQNVVRVRLNPREQPAYYSAEDAAPRQAANAALRQLAEAGVLRLNWRKWEENNWLESVDLREGQAGALYALLGRSPRDDQEYALDQLLCQHAPRAGWHASFLERARTQLAAHRPAAPLDLGDAQLSADMLLALAALADLPGPTLERTLSVQLFRDSKRMEALRAAIVRVLRRHDPDAAAFGEEDWALLQAHGLSRAPEYVPLAGPLTLRVWPTGQAAAPELLALEPFRPSVAISADTLRSAEIAACAAAALVTVENATSFNELLAARPPALLAIYTGGFASPTVIRLLQALRAARPELLFYHWGDLDAGGLRILAHLRAQIGAVAALAMSTAIFDSARRFAQPLSANDRTALAALPRSAALADCAPLIDALLSAGQKLEQEAVPAEHALALIPNLGT